MNKIINNYYFNNSQFNFTYHNFSIQNNSNDIWKNKNFNTAIISNKNRYNNFNTKIWQLKFRESTYKLNNEKYKGNHNLIKEIFNWLILYLFGIYNIKN